MRVEVRQTPQARQPIAPHLSFLPGRHFFFPKLLHTKQGESFPCSLPEAPLIFRLILGGCILIFFHSLDYGLWYQYSLKTKSSVFCILVVGMFLIIVSGLGWSRVCSAFCGCWACLACERSRPCWEVCDGRQVDAGDGVGRSALP